MTPELDDLITVREAAQECGCNPETIRRWIWHGKLPAQKLGNQLFVRRADLASLVRSAKERERAARLAAIEQATEVRGRIQKRIGGYFGVLEALDESRRSHP